MNFIPFAKQAISLLLYITNSSSGSPGSPGAPEPQTMNCNFSDQAINYKIHLWQRTNLECNFDKVFVLYLFYRDQKLMCEASYFHPNAWLMIYWIAMETIQITIQLASPLFYSLSWVSLWTRSWEVLIRFLLVHKIVSKYLWLALASMSNHSSYSSLVSKSLVTYQGLF